MGSKDDNTVYDYSKDVKLRVYELIEGVLSTTAVFIDTAKHIVNAEIVKNDYTIIIDVKSTKSYQVALMNVTKVTPVEKGSFEVVGKDTLNAPAGKGLVTCKLN